VIPRPILKDLKRLVARGLPEKLAALLDDEEREAVLVRALGMVEAGRFPSYPGGFSLPWPPV
jgi:hypothetical protein